MFPLQHSHSATRSLAAATRFEPVLGLDQSCHRHATPRRAAPPPPTLPPSPPPPAPPPPSLPQASRLEEAARSRQATRTTSTLLLGAALSKALARQKARTFRQWKSAIDAAAAEALQLSAEVAVARAEKTAESLSKKLAEASETARRELAAAAAERSGMMANHAAEREVDLAAIQKAQAAGERANTNGQRTACFSMRAALRGAATRHVGRAWRRWASVMADDDLGEVADEVRRSLAETVKSKDRAKRMRRLHRNGRLQVGGRALG